MAFQWKNLTQKLNTSIDQVKTFAQGTFQQPDDG
jgi:hypothetical protein